MLTLKKYLLEVYCSIKQTELVWLLIQNQHNLKDLKTFNLFHSFNQETGEVFRTESDKDKLIIEIESKLEIENERYRNLINEIKTGINETYNPFLHTKLSNSAKKIEELNKGLSMQKSKIIQFKNSVEWICIKYEPFAVTLIKIGLPVITFADNFWWGFFKQNTYPLQQKVINLADKLRINIGDSLNENLELINFAFINEGFLKREEIIKSISNHKTYEETLLKNIETLSNVEKLANTNPNKLRKNFK